MRRKLLLLTVLLVTLLFCSSMSVFAETITEAEWC